MKAVQELTWGQKLRETWESLKQLISSMTCEAGSQPARWWSDALQAEELRPGRCCRAATLPDSIRQGCPGSTGARRTRRSPDSRGPARSLGRACTRTTGVRCTWTVADAHGLAPESPRRPCPASREIETETSLLTPANMRLWWYVWSQLYIIVCLSSLRKFISERELMFMFAICRRASVCRLSSVCRL